MNATTEKRWMTRAEAAKYMGVGEHTIDNWRRAGKLTRHRIKGLQSVRYAVAELDALVVPEEGSDEETDEEVIWQEENHEADKETGDA